MTIDRSVAHLTSLVQELCRLPREAEWVEFKQNKAEQDEIGEYISALSNSAALLGKKAAYVVWGIENDTHRLLGTTFSPRATKVGNEELEGWLFRLLAPRIHFRFFEFSVGSAPLVLLEIGPAYRQPVQFQGREYIRIGSYKKSLKDFPEQERALWRVFDRTSFEEETAADRVPDEDVLRLLDYPAYFELTNQPLPESRQVILGTLERDELIQPCDAGGWNVTNLGAALFAKRLDAFRALRRKAVRVIQYRGDSRVVTLKEHLHAGGYASGFEELIRYVNGLLPSNEVIRQAFRTAVPMYPELSVRELVANAVIHQDFAVTGAGPIIEIFEDRMEVTNPGLPLVSTDRFLDTPPRSRNEAIASLMRRIGICEERGSGVDKVVFEAEAYQLPAPVFEAPSTSTRAVLFAHRPLTRMDRSDRVRACYQHACLKYVNRQFLTNRSIRERFGIEARNLAVASRLIREAVEAGAIVAYDEYAAPKLMKYVPWWARATGERTVDT